MLDIGSLIAGTKFRGEFEDRLKAFMKEIQILPGNCCFSSMKYI